MTGYSAEKFIQEQISDIVKRVEWPRTNTPEYEVPELLAELVYWNDMLREVERARDAA